jgi:hypothetical protein
MAFDPNTSSRIAIVWRGERPVASIPEQSRLWPVGRALEERGLVIVPIVYSEEMSLAVREQLLTCDGALIWVDPLTNGRTRADLDMLLRDAAARGVVISAHPDVILKIGTKEILYRTKDLGWGTDTALYPSFSAFEHEFPSRLISAGPRVLKQFRGNGGQGVWKVALQSAGADPIVKLQQATNRDDASEEMSLSAFIQRCEIYFEGQGRIIDQKFQPRIVDGMIRCYMSGSVLIGLCRQYPKGYRGKATAENTFGLPAEKTMLPSDVFEFRTLRAALERDWIASMCRLLDLDETSLPAVWDADFLFGPKAAGGEDTFILCEINASCVSPFPAEAPARIAEYMAKRVRTRSSRT